MAAKRRIRTYSRSKGKRRKVKDAAETNDAETVHESDEKHLDGKDDGQDRAVSVVIPTQQVLQHSENPSHDILNGSVQHEVETGTSNKDDSTKEPEATYKMETHQRVDDPKKMKLEQNLTCCVICGGPLAVRALREVIHPVTGQPVLRSTPLNPKLDPWLHQKIFFAITMKKLIDDAE